MRAIFITIVIFSCTSVLAQNIDGTWISTHCARIPLVDNDTIDFYKSSNIPNDTVVSRSHSALLFNGNTVHYSPTQKSELIKTDNHYEFIRYNKVKSIAFLKNEQLVVEYFDPNVYANSVKIQRFYVRAIKSRITENDSISKILTGENSWTNTSEKKKNTLTFINDQTLISQITSDSTTNVFNDKIYISQVENEIFVGTNFSKNSHNFYHIYGKKGKYLYAQLYDYNVTNHSSSITDAKLKSKSHLKETKYNSLVNHLSGDWISEIIVTPKHDKYSYILKNNPLVIKLSLKSDGTYSFEQKNLKPTNTYIINLFRKEKGQWKLGHNGRFILLDFAGIRRCLYLERVKKDTLLIHGPLPVLRSSSYSAASRIVLNKNDPNML